MESYKKVVLHNEKNQDKKRWLIVTNSIEGDTRHRDFKYYKYKINRLIHQLIFKVFWGSFGLDLFIETYDMQNLKKWKVGEMTKQLIESGYFEELKKRTPKRIRF